MNTNIIKVLIPIVIIFLNAIGCGSKNEAPRDSKIEISKVNPTGPTDVKSQPHALPPNITLNAENGEEICTKTGGIWTKKMETCSCPSLSVFTELGCTKLRLTESARACATSFTPLSKLKRKELQKCLTKMFENADLSIDLEGLTDAEVSKIADQVSNDPSYFLHNWAIPSQKDKSRFIIDSAEMSKDRVRQGVIYEMDYSTVFPEKIIEIPTEIREFESVLTQSSFQKKVWTLACVDYLNDSGFGDEAKAYCTELISGIQAVFGTGSSQNHFLKDYNEVRSNFVQDGQNCFPLCSKFFYAESQVSDRRMTASITYRDYLPFRRSIGIRGVNAGVWAFISPAGKIEGLLASAASFGQSLDQAIWRKSLTANGGWNVLTQEESKSGNFKVLLEKIKNRNNLQKNERSFDYEKNSNDLLGSISILMVDSGIHLGVPALMGRVSLTDEFLEAIDNNSNQNFIFPFNFNIFRSLPSGFSGLPEILSMFDERSYTNEIYSHGTQMASILVKNLPEAKVHLFPFRVAKHAAAEQWIQVIKNSGARVVNISALLSHNFYDCNRMFEQIFSALPNTLFVVASGNSGAENPQYCPAMAASGSLPNVLSVSGYNPIWGGISKEASYGLLVAKVAAPYSHSCAKAWTIDLMPENDTTTCYGTSVSAAWISNLASRYMVKYPEATAQEVSLAIQGSCQKYGWPVQCEGPVQEWALGL